MPARLRRIVDEARVVLGGARHLAMLPDNPAQTRLPWPSPLRDGLPGLLNGLDGPVVAVASGDPMLSGIGSTLVDLLGAARVRVYPAVSSVALARAELGWAAEDCAVVRVVVRDPAVLARELAPGHKVLVLSGDETTPARVAELLRAAGYGASTMHVLGDLGSERFSRKSETADGWSGHSPRLNVIGIELVGPRRAGWVPGLPDEVFEHDGQLTKRDVRAAVLSRLMPTPGEHLWDVGAGAGSIGIEWMRAHPTCTATAVESNPERARRISRNASTLGVPALTVVTGSAPQALAGLAAPQAVFVGGGATDTGVLQACLDALPAGGRVVVTAVTLQTEMVLADLYARHGGELTRISVESASPIGSFTGWRPARTVTLWTLHRRGPA